MSDTLAILEKLHSLYSGAINQLITYTIGVLAFVGILIPAFVALLQGRQMKRDQQALMAQITKELEIAKTELKLEVKSEMQSADSILRKLVADTRDELANRLKKDSASHSARAFHLQAKSNFDTHPIGCVLDCLTAIPDYVIAVEENNLRGALLLLERSWVKIKAKDIERSPNFDDLVEDAIKALRALNDTGRYDADIQTLKLQVSEARKRTD